MVCHKYWPTFVCIYDASYAVYIPTLAFLRYLRNILTTNFYNLPTLSCLSFGGVVVIFCLGECEIETLHMLINLFPVYIGCIKEGIFQIFCIAVSV